MREHIQLPRMRRGTALYKAAVGEAKKMAEERIARFGAYYEVRHARVSIRKQKTRWGSASTRGTLSFNYRIIFLPPELADYIVVHELCHLKEMNHSARFWALVAETVPDWKERRKALRRYRF
jgi:predicted metal-dependent hydrolase